MNETCMKHALNMPDIGCCPYCKIVELEKQLEEQGICEICKDKCVLLADKYSEQNSKLVEALGQCNSNRQYAADVMATSMLRLKEKNLTLINALETISVLADVVPMYTACSIAAVALKEVQGES